MYPASDRLRFDGGVEEIYVYLRVENLATYGDLEAGVERTSRTSALGRLLGGGGELVVENGGEERLAVSSGGGASGVIKFAVRPASGGALSSGDYTVTVYAAAGRAGQNTMMARKYFVVGGWHG